MTHLYVLNTREYKEKKEDNPLASGDYPLAFFKEKARGERGERARLTLLEGELLSFAVRDCFGEKYLTKTIEKTNFGKLKFANSEKNIEFSISHGGALLVIAVSDEGACGVDIELCDSRPHKGVEKRFLSGFAPNVRSFSDGCAFLIKKELNGGGRVTKIALREPSFEYDFYTRWTALEAILKMSGDGLASYSRAKELLSSAKLSSGEYETEKGEKYIITLAVKSKS